MRHKKQILQSGGQQALSHSPNDIKRIQDALARLRSGSYGVCIDCGRGIAKKRLEAIPESERCIRCQTAFEKVRH